jgi:hypothetical protein
LALQTVPVKPRTLLLSFEAIPPQKALKEIDMANQLKIHKSLAIRHLHAQGLSERQVAERGTWGVPQRGEATPGGPSGKQYQSANRRNANRVPGTKQYQSAN